MPAKLVEFSAIYVSERIRRDKWSVSTVRPAFPRDAPPIPPGKSISVVGDSEPDDFQIGLTYRFYGTWHLENKFGPQFKYKTFVLAQPHGRSGVIRYLQQCKGIGFATAEKLWSSFAGDAVRILRESPDVAVAAVNSPYLNERVAESAAAQLQQMSALEAVTIEMTDLVDGRGFPKTMIREAINRFGNRSVELLRRNPYLSQLFRGVGFKKADAFYLDLGHPPEKLKRQAYCLSYEVLRQSDQAGHVWIPLEEAVQSLHASIGGAKIEPDKAVALAVRGKVMALHCDTHGRKWAADYRRAAAERYCAHALVQAFYETASGSRIEWPSLDRKEFKPLTPHQREKLQAVIGEDRNNPICILGGSPGSGKTFTLSCLANALIAMYGRSQVLISTPTGKAAVRCRQALVANGVDDIVPRTIHSTLRVESAEGEWNFVHREGNPLQCRFWIVDESSMLDTALFRSVLAARNRGTAILFVGDVEQLPPVGYGAPLRDMIAAGIPYGELTEIHRNAGTIIRACKAIREGKPFETDDTIDLKAEAPKNLILCPVPKAAAPAKVLSLLRMLREQSPFDSIWDSVVCVAVNKRSSLSRKTLNPQIQVQENLNGDTITGTPFRVNDKVIQLENTFYPLRDEPDLKVPCFNGEFGRVLAVQERETTIEFSDPQRIVKVSRYSSKKTNGNNSEHGQNGQDENEKETEADTDTGCKADLGFAVTVHKMQGSSAPVVIVCLDEYPGASGQYGICDRSWLYTAISRAEKMCFLVGRMETARAICSRRFIWRRKTRMVELIQEYAAEFGVELAIQPVGIEDLF